jgi:hypothetical protein
MDDSFHQRSDQAIVAGCKEQTARYGKERQSDTRFCLELLRRAFYERPELRSDIYDIYLLVLQKKFNLHPSRYLFPADEVDSFLFGVIEQWQDKFITKGYTLIGLVPALDFLNQLLAWRIADEVKVILRSMRLRELDDNLSGEANITAGYEDQEALAMVLRRVSQRFPDENDRLLCYLWLVHELTPALIVERYPRRWPDIAQVNARLRALRRFLRNDPAILRLLGK